MFMKLYHQLKQAADFSTAAFSPLWAGVADYALHPYTGSIHSSYLNKYFGQAKSPSLAGSFSKVIKLLRKGP
jgi:hypothetical protein